MRNPNVLLLVCFLVILVKAAPTDHANLSDSKQDLEAMSQRDPGGFAFYTPITYDLTLEIETRQTLHYSGRVQIKLKINRLHDGTVGSDIRLNMGPNVVVSMVRYYDVGENDAEPPTETKSIITTRCPHYEPNGRMVHIQLDEPPTQSTGELIIEFSSDIPLLNEFEDQGISFMLGSDNGIYVISDFENHKGSLVFPCFDTGLFMTPITVSIASNYENEVHSTAPVAFRREIYFSWKGSSSLSAGMLTKFKTTEPIYIDSFAFALGPFKEFKENLDSGVTSLSIISKRFENPDDITLMAKAFKMISITLESYTGVGLQSNHLTIIALPSIRPDEYPIQPRYYPGFIIASLEDLIIDLESKLYKSNNIFPLRRLTEFLALESTDLIKNRDVCQKEDRSLTMGFVTLIKDKLIKRVLAERSEEYFIPVVILERLLAMDSSIRSSPVTAMVGNRNIDQAMYKYKTAAIIKMMFTDRALENMDFDRIVSHYYMANHERASSSSEYGSGDGNTDNESCAQIRKLVLTFQQNINLETLYDWLRQPGIPIIYLSISRARMTLTQRRLILDTDGDVAELDNVDRSQRWRIPVTYTLSNGIDSATEGGIVWFQNDDDATINIEFPGWFQLDNPFHFVKLNDQMQGYYRVSYPIPMIESMQMPITSLEMDKLDRLDILTNVGLMWEANHIDSGFFVRFLSWFRYEPVGMVAESLVSWFKKIFDRFMDISVVNGNLRQLGIILFNRLYKRYGFRSLEGLTSAEENSLIEVYKLLITLSYDRLLSEAREYHANGLLTSMNQISSSLAIAALCTQEDMMTAQNYITLMNLERKNKGELGLFVFGASVLHESVIPNLWPFLKHLDSRLRLQLIHSLIRNRRAYRQLETILINELPVSSSNSSHSSETNETLGFLQTIMLNADEQTLIRLMTRLGELPNMRVNSNEAVRKFLRRQELSLRDSDKVLSFFKRNY